MIEFLTYVLWTVTPDGATTNLGEIPIDKNGQGKLDTSTASQTFAMGVTAEPYFAVASYSRARGAFAGVSLKGSTLRPDNDANEKLYGKKIEAKEIVLDGAVNAPPSAKTLLSTLDKASPINKSKS